MNDLITEFEHKGYKLEKDWLGHYIVSIGNHSVYLQGEDALQFEESFLQIMNNKKLVLLLIQDYSEVMGNSSLSRPILGEYQQTKGDIK